VDRVLRSSAATASVIFYVGDVAVDATGPVTVDVLREDGETLSSGTTATKRPNTIGVYDLALSPALHTAEVDVLSLRWHATVAGVASVVETRVEVVGGFAFAVAEFRALADMADTAKYPTARVAAERTRIEALFERACGASFVERYAREVLDGAGGPVVETETGRLRRILSAREDGAFLTGASLSGMTVLRHGAVVRAPGEFWKPTAPGNVELRLVVGWSESYPDDLRAAAMDAVRYRLVQARSGAAIPERATSLTTEAGTFAVATAGLRRPTGLPEIDAVVLGWAEALRSPGVA
jgi:hypothetical protein